MKLYKHLDYYLDFEILHNCQDMNENVRKKCALAVQNYYKFFLTPVHNTTVLLLFFLMFSPNTHKIEKNNNNANHIIMKVIKLYK